MLSDELFKELRDRAKWQHNLTQEEVDFVAQTLRETGMTRLTARLICILGWSYPSATCYRPLIEKFLEYPTDDEYIARAALETLCEMWGEFEPHLSHIIAYVKGKPWDDLEMARYEALACAGEYLREHAHPELLCMMLTICENQGDIASADEQEIASSELAKALGLVQKASEWKGSAAQIIAAARMRLAHETGGQLPRLTEQFWRVRRLGRLLYRLNHEYPSVSREDLQAAVAILSGNNLDHDTSYLILEIIGMLGNRLGLSQELTGYIVPYLESTEWMLAKQALMVLCYLWGKAADYLPHLERFIAGVPYDVWGELRRTALALAGNYLRQDSASTLLQAMLAYYENPQLHQWERECVHKALAKALKMRAEEVSQAALIEAVQERLERERHMNG